LPSWDGDYYNLSDIKGKANEDELSSMIDGASAILSQGGAGSTISVKSQFLASIGGSVRTPRSKISNASTVASSIIKHN